MLFVPRLLRRLVTAVMLAMLLVLGATAGAIWWTARSDDRPRSDAIVVLGASQLDGRPSDLLRSRLQHARALYEQGVAPRVITVGGGAPGDRTTEAAAGKTFLEARGVPTLAVPTGRNTLQSLQALRVLMTARGWRSAVLVTDPWHSLRSRTMARDEGLTAETSPTRSGPSVFSRAVELRYIGRETLAYLAYRLARRG